MRANTPTGTQRPNRRPPPNSSNRREVWGEFYDALSTRKVRLTQENAFLCVCVFCLKHGLKQGFIRNWFHFVEAGNSNLLKNEKGKLKF